MPGKLPPASPEKIPFRSSGTIFTGRTATLRELRERFAAAGNSDDEAAHTDL